MKKALLLSLIILLFGLAGRAPAAPKYGFMSFYTISGKVTGIAAAPAAGRTVIFYKGTPAVYTSATADATGAYRLNASSNLDLLPLKVGETCEVAVVKDSRGYGAGPVSFRLSGVGFDVAPDLTMAYETGVSTAAATVPGGAGKAPEPPPVVKLWFDKRLYQEVKEPTTGENMPFIVADRPSIRVEVSIADNYFLDKVESAGAYSVTVDPGSSYPALDVMAGSTAGRTVTLAGSEGGDKITAQSLEFNLTEPLSSEGDGKHLFVIKARSSGTVGLATSVTAYATVEVLGGPVRLVGTPVSYPSPFSISKQGTVTIQYQLSKNADVQIVLADISGRLTKALYFQSGQEGGSAGVNKATWDGRTDRGTLAGNGIYLGTIISRDDGRKLGALKLTIAD
jgi:hypothetical protein